MRVVKFPRHDIRPVADEIDGVCTWLEVECLAPYLNRLVARNFARELLARRIAALVLPHARHKLDLLTVKRRQLATPRHVLVPPRGNAPHVLHERRGANANHRGRVEQIPVLAVVVASGVDDPRLACAIAAVGHEYLDLVLLAELEERGKLDRTVGMKRHARLLAVHKHDCGAPVELLLEADGMSRPFLRHIQRALEPTGVGGLFVVASWLATFATWLSGKLTLFQPDVRLAGLQLQ